MLVSRASCVPREARGIPRTCERGVQRSNAAALPKRSVRAQYSDGAHARRGSRIPRRDLRDGSPRGHREVDGQARLRPRGAPRASDADHRELDRSRRSTADARWRDGGSVLQLLDEPAARARLHALGEQPARCARRRDGQAPRTADVVAHRRGRTRREGRGPAVRARWHRRRSGAREQARSDRSVLAPRRALPWPAPLLEECDRPPREGPRLRSARRPDRVRPRRRASASAAA